MLLRRSLAATCAIAIAVGLAACGSSSSSGPSPAAYVKSICQAIGPLVKTVTQRSNALNLSISNVKSPAVRKKAYEGFLNQVAADTDKAVGKLKAAGTPNVKNGKQVSTAIVGAFSELQAALQKAATQAGNLPTSSPAAFQSAAKSLGSAVQSSMSGLGGSLSSLGPELEAAAKKEPACTSISA